MSEIQISHNPDLAKLEVEGFRLKIVQGVADHLLIEGIPAVTADKTVALGTLYSPLETDANGRTTAPLASHQCWWIGQSPCDANGQVIEELISNHAEEEKGDGIRTTKAFSRVHGDKRPYADHYEKIWTYVREIWPEARLIDPSCDPRSEKPVQAVVEAQDRAFHYADMATTRAGIGAATAKLILGKVAIIGIGGTGSYILDLVAKTPVQEIHIFDGDSFELHNAFRAPGAPSKEDLTDPRKVDWFGDIYDRMHKGITRHPYHVTADQIGELHGFNFAFVAVDDSEARKVILDGLLAAAVPFIDVGMDLGIGQDHSIRGISRFTVGTQQKHDHIQEVVSFDPAPADQVYRNIQVADINMLNAAMAVGKWKQMCGFCADDIREHHSLYNMATHQLTKEDRV